MKNRFLIGSLFALLLVALLGASNIPHGWTLNSARTAFNVLMKDGGGTVIVPTNKGVADGSSACVGCVGEVIPSSSISSYTVTTSYVNVTGASIPLTPGHWIIHWEAPIQMSIPANTGGNFTQLSSSICLAADGSPVAGTERGLYLQSSDQTAYGTVITNYSVGTYFTSVTSGATYTLQAKYAVSGTDPGVTVSVDNAAMKQAIFYAQRIR